jgi:hypothetical protein
MTRFIYEMLEEDYLSYIQDSMNNDPRKWLKEYNNNSLLVPSKLG